MKYKLFLALILAGIASMAASNNPDGLEKVASSLGFVGHGTEHAALMSGYSVPFLGSTRFSGIVAGIAGVLLTFGLFWLGARIYGRAHRHKITP